MQASFCADALKTLSVASDISIDRRNHHVQESMRNSLETRTTICIDGSLLEKDGAAIIDRDTRIGISRCHRSGVIARIDAIHPTSVAIEPAIAQA